MNILKLNIYKTGEILTYTLPDIEKVRKGLKTLGEVFENGAIGEVVNIGDIHISTDRMSGWDLLAYGIIIGITEETRPAYLVERLLDRFFDSQSVNGYLDSGGNYSEPNTDITIFDFLKKDGYTKRGDIYKKEITKEYAAYAVPYFLFDKGYCYLSIIEEEK